MPADWAEARWSLLMTVLFGFALKLTYLARWAKDPYFAYAASILCLHLAHTVTCLNSSRV